jgi:hypothetical protein
MLAPKRDISEPRLSSKPTPGHKYAEGMLG